MIRFRDSLTLALTKLRTRKVRLIVTVTVSGLLFCALASASLVSRGVFNSVDSFNNEGFGKRYIVQGNRFETYTYLQDSKITDRALAIQKDLVARKKAAAKSLGIDYDPTSEQSPVQQYDGPNGAKISSLDLTTTAGKQAGAEVPHKFFDGTDLAKEAAPYHGTNTYESHNIVLGNSGRTLQVLKGGKEDFTAGTNAFQNGPPTGTDSFLQTWTLMSSDLMRPFILKDATLDDKNDGTIPIIIPVSAAEQLLGLKSLPGTAKPQEKLDRMKQLRSQAANITFQVCYRNSTSTSLISDAVTTAKDIEANKGKKDYQKPELIYGIPSQACAPVAVTQDKRDADTKKLAAKQEQFDEQFGKELPKEEILKFRVVGMSTDFQTGAATGVDQIITSLVTSALGAGWFTPQEYEAKVPLLKTLFTPDIGGFAVTNYYEEFPSAADAHHFLDTSNCSPDYGKTGPTEDPLVQCDAQGKFFSLNPYGSNSLALDSAKRAFSKIFGIAALIAAAIAAVIMMGTVGRMIADSRRETAVFRAIGAKKIDIAQVYVLYTVLLALLICAFSILVGMVVAVVVNQKFGQRATVQALVAYNAQDLSRKFVLFNVYALDMIRLVGLILAASIISSILPLFRNLRRNPIRDMRDDT